jgi:NAD(P)H dehydrogenase (quinone)
MTSNGEMPLEGALRGRPMRTYAILGVTGQVGRAAAEQLLTDGARIRAIVRSEANRTIWRERGAETAVATLDDATRLRAAFEGVDGVFIMTPTWFEAQDMFAENAKALSALRQALCAVSSTKVVLLSSIGAQRPQGTGAIMKLHAMEVAFADLPCVTSIRAGWFMENFAGLVALARETGVLPSMLAPLDREVPMIAAVDIGRTVAEVLQKDWSGQRVIELEGPRRYTPNDVAAAFAGALDRDVEAKVLPATEWHATYLSWGLTPRSAAAMTEMLHGFNTEWISYEKDEAETTHRATPLEAVLSELIRR